MTKENEKSQDENTAPDLSYNDLTEICNRVVAEKGHEGFRFLMSQFDNPPNLTYLPASRYEEFRQIALKVELGELAPDTGKDQEEVAGTRPNVEDLREAKKTVDQLADSRNPDSLKTSKVSVKTNLKNKK